MSKATDELLHDLSKARDELLREHADRLGKIAQQVEPTAVTTGVGIEIDPQLSIAISLKRIADVVAPFARLSGTVADELERALQEQRR